MSEKKRKRTRWPNVIRYPGGTYYAFIKPKKGGDAKEFSLRTKKAAMVPAALQLAELKAERSLFSGSRLTLNETIGDYIFEKKKDWKPRTYSLNIKLIERHIKPFFGKDKIIDIDHNRWGEFCRKTKLKDVMNIRNLLRNFLTSCMYNNWIPAMPLKFKLKKHSRRPRRILKPHEITAIIQNCTGTFEIFVHLCLFHGLRGSEATERKYSDYDPQRNCLLIPETKTGIPRAIPILTFTGELIEAERAKAKSGYIFPKRGARREHASSGWHRKSWVKMLKAAKLVDAEGEPQDITPHDLRATGEKYAAKLPAFTRTEREKMFGAKVEVQDSIYITEFFVDELRGLESAMIDDQKGVDGLRKILESRAAGLGEVWDGNSENELLQ